MTYEIWDKVKSINGVEAKEAVKSLKIKKDDEVYLLKEGESVRVVQTNHNSPALSRVEGEYTIEDLARIHLEMIQEEQKEAEKKQETLEELRENIARLTEAIEELQGKGV